MASVQNLFRERKYPFIFAFTILLLLCFVFLLSFTSNDTNPQFSRFDSSSDRRTSASPSSLSPPNPVDNNPPPSTSSSDSFPPPSPPPDLSDQDSQLDLSIKWGLCNGSVAVDVIPCLDNFKAIKALQSRRHMEHRERHCPTPAPRCLVPIPRGYKTPVQWPKSRDMIWYENVPYPKLVDYKKGQNWVRVSGEYFIFPGGGTQFKDGVTNYIEFIEKALPEIQWGKHVRVVLDVGCGVASFGGYLLDKDVITMSLAPKDEHEAQIQFALERGIPATLSVIGTQKLNFPDNAFDMIHCARCRVHWDADGGKPLMELNRILRPGGYFVWSATPVYRDGQRDQKVWNSMVALTTSICWKVVTKTSYVSYGIGAVIYQKPVSFDCYESRQEQKPPLCEPQNQQSVSWYVPLSKCLSRLPVDSTGNVFSWPTPWPERLTSKALSLSTEEEPEKLFNEDTKHWAVLVSDVYLEGLGINWTSVRNVMDMNAGYGGFSAALIDMPIWVMNVVPVHMQDTLSVIFDRGLIGTYHDWCESLNTYPRTYDLLHSSFLFKSLAERFHFGYNLVSQCDYFREANPDKTDCYIRSLKYAPFSSFCRDHHLKRWPHLPKCDIIDVAAEMDRVLRPGGYVVMQETIEILNRLRPILLSLHWKVTIHQEQFLVGVKGFWRPKGGRVSR